MLAVSPPLCESSSRTEIKAGERLHAPSRLFVFVRFSDDRRLVLVIRFGVVVVLLVIIIIVIVGISRWHRVAHDGDESPLGRGKVLRDVLGHVGSLLDVRAETDDTTADQVESKSLVLRVLDLDPVL